MRLISAVAIATLALLCPAAPRAVAEEKGTTIELDNLKSRTPADWKAEKPGPLRLAQFVLPGRKGDDGDTELIIFKGLGGGAQANIARWKMQFTPPPGKKVDDVAVVKEIKIGGKPATMLETEGTYKTTSFDPKYKGKALPGFRMIAIYFDGPDNVYQIKLTGPDKTVAEHKKAFEDWIKAFK